jgi:predicted nuclease of predicted toxin-antitoxin system
VKFLVDNQLPPALASLIQREFGEEASHVVDIGMRDATDAELWSYASATNAIVISKDEDFANMVLRTPTAGLLWVRVGNCRAAILLDVFRRVWPESWKGWRTRTTSSRSDDAVCNWRRIRQDLSP